MSDINFKGMPNAVVSSVPANYLTPLGSRVISGMMVSRGAFCERIFELNSNSMEILY